jgi:ACT domain-containing protein
MIYSFSLAQRATVAHANRPTRALDARQHRLCLPLVVDECDVLRVRRAVIQSAGGKVEIVRCVPIRNSAKVRLTIELQAGALDETIQRIMQSIKAGELGRIGLAP